MDVLRPWEEVEARRLGRADLQYIGACSAICNVAELVKLGAVDCKNMKSWKITCYVDDLFVEVRGSDSQIDLAGGLLCPWRPPPLNTHTQIN